MSSLFAVGTIPEANTSQAIVTKVQHIMREIF